MNTSYSIGNEWGKCNYYTTPADSVKLDAMHGNYAN